MKVILGSSRRFKDDYRAFAAGLKSVFAEVVSPTSPGIEDYDELSEERQTQLRLERTRKFLDELRTADMMLVYNRGGYVGFSVAMEIGFALARGIPVYFLFGDAGQPEVRTIRTMMNHSGTR